MGLFNARHTHRWEVRRVIHGDIKVIFSDRSLGTASEITLRCAECGTVKRVEEKGHMSWTEAVSIYE
jgi:uncharacterized Zn finger protein